MQKLYSIEWEGVDGWENGYTVKLTLHQAIEFCEKELGFKMYRLSHAELLKREGIQADDEANYANAFLPTWENQAGKPTITINEYNDQGSASPLMWRMLWTKMEEDQ